MTHELKVHPEHYRMLVMGLKKVEVRLNDRNYQVNDLLLLNEYNPKTQKYSGSQVVRNVDLIISGIDGLAPDYVVLQISKPLKI